MLLLSRSTIATHGMFLALAHNTIYNMAFETQQFTTSLVHSQIQPLNMWWGPDCKTVTCEGHSFPMDDLRSGMQDLISHCWVLYDKITLGQRFATKLPEIIQDDITMDERGYSFLYHGPYTKKPHTFLTYLYSTISPYNVGTVRGNAMHWDVTSLCELLANTAEFNKLLTVLCFILPAIYTRVSEFLVSKFTNDSCMRTLVVMLKELVHISIYHKTTNQTGLDVCIPAFFPESRKELVLGYLAGGLRDCETMFSEHA